MAIILSIWLQNFTLFRLKKFKIATNLFNWLQIWLQLLNFQLEPCHICINTLTSVESITVANILFLIFLTSPTHSIFHFFPFAHLVCISYFSKVCGYPEESARFQFSSLFTNKTIEWSTPKNKHSHVVILTKQLKSTEDGVLKST